MLRDWLRFGSQVFRMALGNFRHAGQVALFGNLPRTRFDYKTEVGRGDGSSVVMAPVKFIQRVFPEAPLKIRKKTDGASREEILDAHPMTELIRTPNGFYSGVDLWKATIGCWILDGNAYWMKLRDALGAVVELWWIPPWLMSPAHPRDGSKFITHYEYTPTGAGRPIDVDVSDVVHFRNGLDPRNPRLGMSEIYPVFREIFSDDEASNFVASILRNSGVPGVVISPKTGTVDAAEALAAERRFSGKFGGDKRGTVMAMRSPTEVHQYAWSPAQLELGSLRDVSEERVCAIIGIPAAVAGFGAGLQQTKVGATMKELVKLAWMACITPMQTSMAADLDTQLLPSFEPAPGVGTFFDSQVVEALQENEKERADRFTSMIAGGWVRVAEGRRAFRMPVDESDEVYIHPTTGKPLRSWADAIDDPGGTDA